MEDAKKRSGTFQAMNILAMASSYDPDPSVFLGMRLPVTFDTCELIPDRWRNWLRHDPVVAVEDLGEGTFAIGEPRYYQQNYSYLIVGTTRALLFDSGSGTRDVSSVVGRLTRLPVTVMVSHLHFDHFGGIAPFEHVALIDLPETRADMSGSFFRPGRYEYMGLVDGRAAPSIRVGEWLAPGSIIELGGRSVRVLSTPGHTPTSVALFDAQNKWLFIGDFIYPTTLYAFLPGASLSAYQATAKMLLDTLPSDAVLWTAHCCRKNEGVRRINATHFIRTGQA